LGLRGAAIAAVRLKDKVATKANFANFIFSLLLNVETKPFLKDSAATTVHAHGMTYGCVHNQDGWLTAVNKTKRFYLISGHLFVIHFSRSNGCAKITEIKGH